MIANAEAFLIAITILTLTPGLDTALVIRNASRGGAKDGIAASLGICFGLFVHATLSAVGISAILAQSAEVFSMVKMIGAVYLIWLGVSTIKDIYKGKSDAIGWSRVQHKSNIKRSVREGFLSNVLNPKTAVFYLAFLPQFINPEGSVIGQTMAMASIHFVIAMVWQSGLAVSLSCAKNIISNANFLRRMEATTGAVLVGLGIKLMSED
ncbi:LysE family translocator [Vibrio pectenicida]|uniref:LysE family translocator n=1 Tax=Vibrio pectenicida TaxID=62763 RepID=A0A3R9EHB7_9VIBR|nr:LysE family translocator [Vibrio pectenicida]RSD30435.1 LysE family translocator [Vibrio pectenicida]